MGIFAEGQFGFDANRTAYVNIMFRKCQIPGCFDCLSIDYSLCRVCKAGFHKLNNGTSCEPVNEEIVENQEEPASAQSIVTSVAVGASIITSLGSGSTTTIFFMINSYQLLLLTSMLGIYVPDELFEYN